MAEESRMGYSSEAETRGVAQLWWGFYLLALEIGWLYDPERDVWLDADGSVIGD